MTKYFEDNEKLHDENVYRMERGDFIPERIGGGQSMHMTARKTVKLSELTDADRECAYVIYSDRIRICFHREPPSWLVEQLKKRGWYHNVHKKYWINHNTAKNRYFVEKTIAA